MANPREVVEWLGEVQRLVLTGTGKSYEEFASPRAWFDLFHEGYSAQEAVVEILTTGGVGGVEEWVWG